MIPIRTRVDRCPGVLRPWPAEDGLLVRLRPAGGLLPAGSLRRLLRLAAAYGDGDVHVTGRANLQIRGIEQITKELVEAFEATGLLPSRSHELVRNLMVSPQTGSAGGRADLRPVVGELDRMLCDDAELAALPGRFLFVLDDGRGDLLPRPTDLGLVVLDEARVQLRVGAAWGPCVPIEQGPAALVDLARRFLERRTTQWHVTELGEPLVAAEPPHPAVPAPALPLPYGEVLGGVHVPAPRGIVDPALGDRNGELVVTPWRGVLVPEMAR